MGHVRCSAVARFLGAKLSGADFNLSNVSSFYKASENTLVFIKKKKFTVPEFAHLLILCPPNPVLDIVNSKAQISYIQVENPKLAFAKVLREFFVTEIMMGIHPTAIIADDAIVHPNVSIGAYSIIESNVVIKKGTVVNNHVVIRRNALIGENCYIKSGSVIGEDGFGFAFECDETPIRVPHIGNVIIGNNVEIGANCTVARGTLDDTVIGDDVKIDDQVHIAHNCFIGEKSIITACSELSGSVILGEQVWIGPNSSIIQNTNIGDKALVGIGSVIDQNVLGGRKVMGVAALGLKTLVLFKKFLDQLGSPRAG